MDTKTAIEQLESLKEYCTVMTEKPEEASANDIWRQDVEALSIALDALRAKV